MSFTTQPPNKLERCPWLGMNELQVPRSNSVHTARYNSSLCDCQLLALEFWMNPHSPTQMKKMYFSIASMFWIHKCKGHRRKWLLNRRNKKSCWHTAWRSCNNVHPGIGDVGSCKIKRSLRCWESSEKPKEASLQKQNFISSETNFATMLTH